jgi:aerobic carbon-monoxide dehydrogenase medium subunit
MLPSSFECQPAGCIDEALSLLSQPGDDAKVLAGGRSLIPAA